MISQDIEIFNLLSLGWHLVPIRYKEKRPAQDDWGSNTFSKPEQVRNWIQANSRSNWGVLLGPKSGVVDIEDDTPEGREILTAAMQDCGVRTPCYTSGKSVHRLFQHDDRFDDLTAVNYQLFGCEFRFGGGGKAAQSVVPPSVHPTGVSYAWLPGLSPDDAEVARLPDEMWELFLELREQDAAKKAEERQHKQAARRRQPVDPVAVNINGVYTSHVDAAEAAIEQLPFDSLLTAEGWRHSTGDEWTRPGDDWTNGKSATLGTHKALERLTVWSNAAPIEGGTGDGRSCYSKWRFWYSSNGFLDTQQIAAAKAFLGEQKSAEVDAAFRGHKQPDAKQPEQKKPEQTFCGIDIAALEEFASAEMDWLVSGVFSADQPTLFGDRSKCLKTTQLVDLGIALASGTDWLGEFKIPKKRRVLFITGEANNRAISRRMKKAAKARGLTMAELSGMIRVEAIDFPKLPNIIHCQAVADTIKKYDIEVVIIDPLYRGIPSDMDTNRMAQVGDAIVNFVNWCQPASVIISHHVTKAAARELGTPPELEDMTGAGIAESCGNWWLVGRNEKYAWDWQHDLCVQFGGRDEQCGGRRILFDEKTWTATVENLHEFIGQQQETAQRAREDAKREKHYREIESARARVQSILRHVKTPLSKNQIEERRGEITQKNIRAAIFDMESDQTLSLHDYRDSRNRLQSGGYLLAENGSKYEAEFQASENQQVGSDVPDWVVSEDVR